MACQPVDNTPSGSGRTRCVVVALVAFLVPVCGRASEPRGGGTQPRLGGRPTSTVVAAARSLASISGSVERRDGAVLDATVELSPMRATTTTTGGTFRFSGIDVGAVRCLWIALRAESEGVGVTELREIPLYRGQEHRIKIVIDEPHRIKEIGPPLAEQDQGDEFCDG